MPPFSNRGFHFFVKIHSYIFIFIKLVHFLTILTYELYKNLAFDDKYSLFRLILLKPLPIRKNMNLCPPIKPAKIIIFS